MLTDAALRRHGVIRVRAARLATLLSQSRPQHVLPFPMVWALPVTRRLPRPRALLAGRLGKTRCTNVASARNLFLALVVYPLI